LSDRVRNEAGYSLVEVMVAIMILAIAILPMVGMFDAGLRAATMGSSSDKARTLASEKLEEVESLSFSDALARYPEGNTTPCNPAPPPGSQFTCQVRTDYMRLGPSAIEDSAYETRLAQVTVTVSWPTGGPLTTTGLIGK
jgi:prepilin-type N-terminal cleavage/methylation domain-containing protein